LNLSTTESLQFQAADNLWVSYQQRIRNFVNDPAHGGNQNSSVILTPVKNRPKMQRVIDALNNNDALSTVDCD
jgi:hypothetical protein